MIKIVNRTGTHNGFAIVEEKDKVYGDKNTIMSGLTYNQAERELLRIKKEKETVGDSILQDRGCD